MANYVTQTSDKDKKTAAILCACGFLGIGGLHYFYVGRIGKGVLYLCTFGFFLIGTIFDLVSISTGGFRDNVGAPLRNSSSRSSVSSSPSDSLASTTHPDKKEFCVYAEIDGKKYHNDPKCSGMKNPQYMPISKAKRMGKAACKKCATYKIKI